MIEQISDRVLAVQTRHRANFADEGFNNSGDLRWGLTEVCFEWAKGMVSGSLSDSGP